MGGETERLEREINAYLTGLPGFDLDVYRDIFSSEYVNNVIYNHPERIRRIQPVLDRLGFIRNTHFVLTMIFDNFWNICQKRDNAYRYQLPASERNQAAAHGAGGGKGAKRGAQHCPRRDVAFGDTAAEAFASFFI